MGALRPSRAVSGLANRDPQGRRKGGFSREAIPGFVRVPWRDPSTDLRERVVEAVNEGATRLEAAERFGVSVSSAVRWHQAWRETGTFEARSCGGSCSPLDDYAEEILALVEEQDDRTLDEIVVAMRKHRIPGSRASPFRLSGASRHYAQKKSCTLPSRSERTWPAPAGAGYASKGCLISTHLVFIDETSVNTNMTRAYGRGLEGERVIGRVPFAAWQTLTFVAALRMREHDRADVDQGGDERRSLSRLCRTVSGPDPSAR